MTLAELRLQYYVPWRNWQLTFHFTGFSLNWTSLELILLNSYIGSVFTQRIGISHLAFQPLLLPRYFSGASYWKDWVLRRSFRHCTWCTPDPILKPKLYFFFLSKDRETNSMLFPSFEYWFFSSISLLLFPLQCLQIIVFFIFYSELILVICRRIHLQDLTHPYRSVT